MLLPLCAEEVLIIKQHLISQYNMLPFLPYNGRNSEVVIFRLLIFIPQLLMKWGAHYCFQVVRPSRRTYIILRPKEKICVFPVTSPKKLG